MKIKKSRLFEIIKEEIEDVRLRKRIRGMIREFTGGSTSMGGATLAKGRKSQATKDAKRSLDKKSADFKTKKTASTAKSAAVDNSKKYRKAGRVRGTYTYSATSGIGYSVNPDWTAQDRDARDARTAEISARDAETAAQTTLDSAEEDDLRKSTPTQTQQSGGGKAGGGKGKGKDDK